MVDKKLMPAPTKSGVNKPDPDKAIAATPPPVIPIMAIPTKIPITPSFSILVLATSEAQAILIAKVAPKMPVKTLATELPEKKVPGKKVAKAKKKKLKYGSRYKKMDRNPAGGELIDDTGAKEKFVAAEDQYPRRGIFDAGDPEYKRFKLKDYQIKEAVPNASQNRNRLTYSSQ